VIKKLVKYPAIFCILLLCGYGLPFHYHFSYKENISLLSLRKVKSPEKEFVTASDDLLFQSAPSHEEKRNVDYPILGNEVDEEDLDGSKKHLSNRALCIYACHLSILQDHRVLAVYNFNKSFSYNTSYLYLAFQVFRI
jgi:hypothetical protein